MPLISSLDTFSSGKREEERSFDLAKFARPLLIIVLVAIVVLAVYLNWSRLTGLIPSFGSGDEQTTAQDTGNEEGSDRARDPEASPVTSEVENVEEVPPSAEKTGKQLFDAVVETYKAPVVHTTGSVPLAGSRADFDTTWTTDRQIGSGTMTLNGKTAQVFLIKEVLFIKNDSGIVSDAIGKPVPFAQWVLVNSADTLHTVFPDTYLLEPLRGKPTTARQDHTVTADDFSFTFNEDDTRIEHFQTPVGVWDLKETDAKAISQPGADFKVEGKVEKDDAGNWRVYRLYEK